MPQVDEARIGSMLGPASNRLVAAGGFEDHVNVGFALQHGCEPSTHGGMVISNDQFVHSIHGEGV
jgi:hypothetical protein